MPSSTGYSIFISVGNLPDCEADQLLKLIPAVQTIKPRLINEKSPSKKSEEGETDVDIQKAMEESKNMLDGDDAMLQQTLQQSMEGGLVRF